MVRLDTEIAAGLKPAKGLWGKVKDKLGHFAMASDNAVRQATYTAALDQGLSKAEALEKAFEIFNVRRRGSSKMLNLAGQVIPFFNAYLTAQNVAYRTITGVGTSPTQRDAAYKVLFNTTASVFALSVLYAMMNGDDEDYLKKPTPTRDRLLMIPGTGMSIPLRADLYALPKVVAEHTYMILTDKGYSDGAKFRASLKSLLASSVLSPTPVPQAIKPLVEIGINYDFFQQKPLIGTYQKKKELERQFEDSTSELAKVLGRSNLVSPIAVDHFVRGMFGSAGGLVLYATNPFLWHVTSPNTPRPSISMQDALATIPNASGFITKEYETGLKKDFFALKEEVDRAANTLTDLKQRNPEDIKDYIKDEKVRARLGLAPMVNTINTQLSTIRKGISTITNSNLPSDVKESRIKQLRDSEEKMLKGINLKKLREMAQI
jgi:flavin-binding protein dodecin